VSGLLEAVLMDSWSLYLRLLLSSVVLEPFPQWLSAKSKQCPHRWVNVTCASPYHVVYFVPLPLRVRGLILLSMGSSSLVRWLLFDEAHSFAWLSGWLDSLFGAGAVPLWSLDCGFNYNSTGCVSFETDTHWHVGMLASVSIAILITGHMSSWYIRRHPYNTKYNATLNWHCILYSCLIM
jgi:hypothetical protein